MRTVWCLTLSHSFQDKHTQHFSVYLIYPQWKLFLNLRQPPHFMKDSRYILNLFFTILMTSQFHQSVCLHHSYIISLPADLLLLVPNVSGVCVSGRLEIYFCFPHNAFSDTSGKFTVGCGSWPWIMYVCEIWMKLAFMAVFSSCVLIVLSCMYELIHLLLVCSDIISLMISYVPLTLPGGEVLHMSV